MRLDLRPGFWLYLALLWPLNRLGLFRPYLLAAALHEAGHAGMQLLLGGRLISLRLGFCDLKMETSPLPKAGALAMTLAGPCVNLLCAGALGTRFPGFAAVSLLLGMYNLLPILPLDGGRLLALLLGSAPAQRISLAACVLLLLGAVWAAAASSLGLWPLAAALLRLARTCRDEITVAFPLKSG